MDKAKLTEEVTMILKEARFARKGDYRTYENFKQRIEDLDLSYEMYSQAIHSLARILRI